MTDYTPLTRAQRAALRRFIADGVARAVADRLQRERPYPLSYSILTVHFAEGSAVQALSIPYKAFDNRTDIHLPYRLEKVEP